MKNTYTYTPTSYKAVIAGLDPDLPCECDECEWRGLGKHMLTIWKCALTPGDQSPAGRCPECGALAYVSGPPAGALAATDLARTLRDNIERILVFNKVSLNGDHVASVADIAKSISINGDCVQINLSL